VNAHNFRCYVLALVCALVLFPKDAAAKTTVKIGGVEMGALTFASVAEERNYYTTSRLYAHFGYTAYPDIQGGLVFSLEGADANWEIPPIIGPRTYKFSVSYSIQGNQSSNPIYWRVTVGYLGYIPTVYLYGGETPMKINYGETISGEIIVDDVGQKPLMLEKVLETDGQVYLTGQLLPKNLKVKVTGDDSVIKKDRDIVFSVDSPTSNCSFSADGTAGKTIVVKTLDDGTASVPFKLGDVPETYKIKAVCDSCLAGTAVEFSATGKTLNQFTELRPDMVENSGQCESYGRLSSGAVPLFRVVAVDTLTGKPRDGLAVTFSTVGFIGNGVQHGALVHALAPTSGPNGHSWGDLRFGDKEGEYVVSAHCADCLGNQEVICRGRAKDLNVYAATPKAKTGNPEEYPLLRFTFALPPNDGKSFTTAEGENLIGLRAQLLPQNQYNQSIIKWHIERTNADSGSPRASADGPYSDFGAVLGDNPENVPVRPAGRPLPLRYKVYATAEVNNKPLVSEEKIVTQDEIDKCRQEYIDFGIVLDSVPRGRFVAGLNSEFAKNPLDCFAHILSQRAGEVAALRENRTIRVNSAYRSPRKNKSVKGAPLSWHIFGNAIDIEILPETALNYQVLWDDVDCPELLESNGRVLMGCDASGVITGLPQYVDKNGNLKNLNGNNLPDVFETLSLSGWLHMGH